MPSSALGWQSQSLNWVFPKLNPYYNPVGLFLKYAFPGMMLGLMNQGMKQLQQKLGGKGSQMHKVM